MEVCVLLLTSWTVEHLIILFRQRKLRVFLCGDYEFMCRLYGLSGASGTIVAKHIFNTLSALPKTGRHSCLWCLIKSSDMRTPLSSRGESTRRTVQGIIDDHERFVKAGGDIRKAKEYNNCIAKPFFDIPISQVLLIHSKSNTHFIYYHHQYQH